MRLETPRIGPLREDELSAEQRAILAPLMAQMPLLNIFATMARNPAALKAFLVWGNYILAPDGSLTTRQREIIILRVGFLCKSGYEFAQHEQIGLAAGLSRDEIARLKQGADAGWAAAEAVLIRMADELVADHFISDQTWRQLRANFSEVQCMDAVYTVGQYTQVSMLLNSFGVQLDPGLELDPALRG